MSTAHAPARRLVFLGALTLALTALHAADVCPLRVNDESGVTTPWPLVGGLPLPTGAVRDATNIRIVDAQGREVPAQIDVAATWPSSSPRNSRSRPAESAFTSGRRAAAASGTSAPRH